MKYDDNNKEKVTDTKILEPNASMLSYDDLLASVKAQFLSTETPWKLTFESHAYFDMSLYDNKLINGVRVCKVLQVFNNLSWIVSYAGVQATENLFSDVPDKISSTNDFSNIIKILENVHICVGVNNQPFIALQAETVNIHGEIIGSLQSVTTVNKDGNEQVVSTRRSTSCTYFIHNTTSSRCSSCNLLRRSLSVQLVRYNNGNSINGKRAMSEDERKGREHELKRKLINTEKREKYWKFKATEMKKLNSGTWVRCIKFQMQPELF